MVVVHANHAAANLVAVAPLHDRAFANVWEELVFWLGRLLTMIPMKYTETAFGGAAKVAATFRARITDDVILQRLYRQDEATYNNQHKIAYDLTWLSSSHIDTLNAQLTACADLTANQDLLAIFKRAELLSKTPKIRHAIQNLIRDFENKVVTQLMQPAPQPRPVHQPAPVIPVAAVPVSVVPAPRAPRATHGVQIAEALVVDEHAYLHLQPALNSTTKAAARLMVTPHQRYRNDTGQSPILGIERPSQQDFLHYLNTRNPDFSAVKELAHLLDQFSADKATKLLNGLPLLARLYLYEVADTRRDLILNNIAEEYHTMAEEGLEFQYTLRAYLILHRTSARVGERYIELLQKIEEFAW